MAGDRPDGPEPTTTPGASAVPGAPGAPRSASVPAAVRLVVAVLVVSVVVSAYQAAVTVVVAAVSEQASGEGPPGWQVIGSAAASLLLAGTTAVLAVGVARGDPRARAGVVGLALLRGALAVWRFLTVAGVAVGSIVELGVLVVLLVLVTSGPGRRRLRERPW